MKIRDLFLSIAVVEVVWMSAIVFFYQKNVAYKESLNIAQTERYAMREAADRLRQSSDDLTRFARTYVVTGDEVYKNRYDRVLDIRDGKAPRPKDYENIYWDYLDPGQSLMHPDGEALSLDAIMDALPYSEEERALLDESHRNSNELVNLEREAFHSMEGRFKDAEGQYTIKRAPDQPLAIRLLHSSAYHRAKQKIMQPIDRFLSLLQQRTLQEVAQRNVLSQRNSHRLEILIWIFVLVNVFVVLLLRHRVVKTIGYITDEIRQGEHVELDRSRFRHQDELGEMMDAFNAMQSTIDERTQLLAHSNEELEQLNASLQTQVEYEVAERTKAIEERNLNEKLLMQQSKLAAMGEMIHNIAHQWRQPLNSLGLVLQNIRRLDERKQLDTEKLVSLIEKGMMLVNQMSSTIDDFRNYFRTDKRKQPFSLKEEALRALKLVHPAMERHHISVREELNEDVRGFGFPNEFGQCLLNLIQNSKDALDEKPSGEERWIHISITQQGEMGCLILEDNGGGIPESVMLSIFDPYFTTKEEGKGTGIGLYMSKVIIEKHMDGRLNVSNTEYGARFKIELPLAGELGS